MTWKRLALWLTALAIHSAATAAEIGAAQPEQGFSYQAKPLAEAREFMVAAAHPQAARTGYEILEAGGTAVDAAVAVQMVLNLVEPQSSGIGGGAFLVYWDAAKKRLLTLDGRETAPMAIEADRFLDVDGEPLPWWQRITGGRSVGVPGTLRLLEEAHGRFGRSDWPALLEPAIRLAREGFTVSPRLASSIEAARDRGLKTFDATRAYFFDAADQPIEAGAILKNSDFADTLSLIAVDGARAFYEGEIARDIVAAVNASHPGAMSIDDLSGYRVVERPPVCAPYGRFQVCGMGPPSSGALTVGQILGLVAAAGGVKAYDVAGVHRILEAQRLAYADRARYIADSDFFTVPVSGLLDPDYLNARAALIDPARTMGQAEAGDPPRLDTLPALASDHHAELAGTSHISIVDRYGNVLSMTTTIESGFGSRLMTRGFLLNNELTDFSPLAEIDGRPVANRIEPGKRPRSSMAPTIVLDADDRPVLAIGSPGGSRIINYVANALISILSVDMDVAQALARPHFGNRNGNTELEASAGAEGLADALRDLGHEVILDDMNSGLQAIMLTADGRLLGGADPRREGVAVGD